MIPVDVDCVAAEWTRELFAEDRTSDLALDHDLEKGRVDVFVEGFGWDRVEPLARSARAGMVDMGLELFVVLLSQP